MISKAALMEALGKRFDYQSTRNVYRDALSRAGLADQDGFSAADIERFVTALKKTERRLEAVLGALGWFATATLVGRGITGRDGADRSAMMRSLTVGTAVLLLPFALAALLPGWGDGLLALAIGVVWVATTAGFGAAVLTRGGRSPAR